MDLKDIEHITEERLPQVKTLITVLVVLIGAFIPFDMLLQKFLDSKTRLILYCIILLLWITYWSFNKFYLPRNKKNKVGIVIAIYSENEEERQKLKADFISKLKKDLRQEGTLDFSEVIFLKNHFAYKINESSTGLDAINKKIKAHFYVYGDVKKRPDGDEGEKYFINFQGYVVHEPISKNLSRKLSIDFSKVLPRQVNFLEKRRFRGFEASAAIVHLAAKYIIGVAAFVSHNPILALKLHDGLKEQFNTFQSSLPHLQDIINQIPILISDETLWVANWHFKKNEIGETKKYLQRSLSENNSNYDAWLLKAIIDFLIDKNPAKALESISNAKKYGKGKLEWRYSEAFLYFWKEDYIKALKICQDIRKQNYPNEEITLSSVREFNLKLLKEQNPKAQLYFWIGYLSYFKDKNLGNALEDFEKFEKLANSTMSVLIQKSSAYLREIKQKMEIKS